MNFARLAGALVVFAVALAGCKQPRLAGPQDAGVICEEGERLVGGACRFVCERDGHCPEGQRCNLFVGMCEPRPPPPDAGPILIPCTTGADRCTADAKAIETCGAGSTWSVSQTCPVPDGFCKNEKCLACQPGAASCVPPVDGGASSQIAVCLDDGSGLRTVTCAGSATCTQGECRQCTPGSTRCSADSKSLQTCQKQADETLTWTWVNTGDNLDGTCITQVCELNSTTTSPQCKPPACIPGATSCLNTTTQQVCSALGAPNPVSCTLYPDGGTDPAGECQNGVCVHECEQAIGAKSYFGCEYWTAVMDNGFTPGAFKGGTTSGQGTAPSEFGFVVTNRSALDATVTITRVVGGSVVPVSTTLVKGKNDVATKGLATIRVPWQSIGTSTEGSGASGLERYGYKISSTRPVTVYQFNPLAGVGKTGTCSNANQCTLQSAALGPKCVSGVCNYYSYTNDASLLLPAHILGTSYVAMATEHVVTRPTTSGTPTIKFNGTLTLIGTQTTTTVTVKASTRTRAGGAVAAMAKGEIRQFVLQPYDVLQLSTDNPTPTTNISCGNSPYEDPFICSLFGCAQFCRVVDGDITGTIVTSDKPIAAFGGSFCTTRGYLDAACDHVEEQLFPFVTWGKKFVAPRTAPLRLTNNAFASAANAGPDYYKIVAGCPDTTCPTGTTVTLSAAVPSADVLANPGNGCEPGTSLTANNCRLRGGRFVEFRMKSSFTVTADQPISIGQFFASQSATTGTTLPLEGDPSFVLLPPIEQWRASYTVLNAADIRDNYIGLVIDDTKVLTVQIDGNPVPPGAWVAIAGSPFKVANVAVASGTHTVDVTPKAGITPLPGAGVTVYGFDEYVSYGYTGGLDLTTIVSGINPGG